ncbi:hypothetical protein CJD36_006910 [Flavipsychrobacter stenotrophus]|uniref:Uncharacterized protein n=1 Tax=Flavipsychrobacter stenotrophus TaxID=2077091 RepID=A0A2S7SYB9_9BACT|nr:glycosyltransferase family 39 protein [Flavipsychrobacter stenotrophus]PQJ11526.1 hypothetical protein CJD36_006910 [Flavipsychrobacter stenotrophus]
MKHNTAQKQPGRAIVKGDVQKKGTFPQNNGQIIVNLPVLWLALAALLVYVRTIGFGFTELDDSIFIREFHEYNENLANLATSFHRGLFDAIKDPYFRPVFLDSMVVNYLFAKQNILGYHLVNVALHVGSVIMLYNVFVRLRIRKLHSFIITLMFAVHPVLCQAVAWIPGRNDTLLALFSFSFFYYAIDYSDFGKIKDLLLSILFLLIAYFTKESAVFVPVVAFVMFVLVIGDKWISKNKMVLYGSWVACFLIWYAVRSQASNIQAGNNPNIGIMVTDFIHRLPLIPQYIGKILLPVNQSVFPMQEDTSMKYGIIAIIMLAASLFLSKNVNWKIVIAGAVIFMLFLIPALLVPNNLNEQTFEHRLYLPIIGILIIFTETFLFKRLIDSQTVLYGSILCVVFSGMNFAYQGNFSSPYIFWTNAVETSPHSAYAAMMLGAREDNLAKSYELFHRSYKLDPKQKYINYYYGMMLQKQDSVIASEPYLLAEKANTDFVEVDFYLARVAMTKNDTTGAMNYLKSYLKRMPTSEPANNNLLLMYINKGQIAEAKAHTAHMSQMGMRVPDEIVRILNGVH